MAGDWDPVLPVLLDLAEHTGDLADAFAHAERAAHAAWADRMQWVMRLLEPAVLMLLGMMVLATIASIFVPLYDQMSTIERL